MEKRPRTSDSSTILEFTLVGRENPVMGANVRHSLSCDSSCQPKERLLEVVVALGTDIIVLNVLSSVESHVLSLDDPLCRVHLKGFLLRLVLLALTKHFKYHLCLDAIYQNRSRCPRAFLHPQRIRTKATAEQVPAKQ
eukprot:4461855-Amphidinium_carterae.1